MFGFGNKKSELADSVIAFHVEEIATNLLAALSFPGEQLQGIARDLYLTYSQIDLVPNPRAKRRVLVSLSQYALANRHEALRVGADSRLHPLWNVASLIESIAAVELFALDGIDREDAANSIRSRVERLTSRYLSDEARSEIRAIVAQENE